MVGCYCITGFASSYAQTITGYPGFKSQALTIERFRTKTNPFPSSGTIWKVSLFSSLTNNWASTALA
jgi:hypothetical protein